jgi:hypothetical protein
MRDAQATPSIAKGTRSSFAQTKALVSLAQQENTAVTDDITAIKRRFDHTASNPTQFD